jgi:hypothetical protein
MTWTFEQALRTTYVVAKSNFGPFFTAAAVLTAPTLAVDLLGGGTVVSLIVDLLTNVLVSVSLARGTIQAMAGRTPILPACSAGRASRASGRCSCWASCSGWSSVWASA